MRKRSRQQWQALWQRIGAQGDAQKIYDDLLARYGESHRAYHTITHIEHCLDELGPVKQLAINLNRVELAIWYHDAIYNTMTRDNEERSAGLAMMLVQQTSLPDGFGESLKDMILATRHAVVPADPDTRLLIDIDLSILGQPEDKFDIYETQIRAEYGWVPEDKFVAGRSAILMEFLKRQAIYSTAFFYEKYEAQARANITRSLAKLSRPL